MKSRSKAIVLSLPPLAKHSNGYQKAKWYRKMKWPLRSLVHMKLIRRCSFFTPTSHAEMPQGDQVFLPAPFVSLENARSKLPKVSQWSSDSAQLWHSQFGKKTGHQKTWNCNQPSLSVLLQTIWNATDGWHHWSLLGTIHETWLKTSRCTSSQLCTDTLHSPNVQAPDTAAGIRIQQDLCNPQDGGWKNQPRMENNLDWGQYRAFVRNCKSPSSMSWMDSVGHRSHLDSDLPGSISKQRGLIFAQIKTHRKIFRCSFCTELRHSLMDVQQQCSRTGQNRLIGPLRRSRQLDREVGLLEPKKKHRKSFSPSTHHLWLLGRCRTRCHRKPVQ